jgi:hypothetical protein
LRRFVASLPGKFVCHTVVTALLLPFLTLATFSRAEAQIQVQPTWAVVDFINKAPGMKGGERIGALAADSVATELSASGKYDVTPREQVQRQIDQLNLVRPVTDATSLYRLATGLSATALITGEVVNWQVRPNGNGKQADVAIRVVVRDVVSGLPINGAAQGASSSVRPGDTPDEVLLNEAFSLAAAKVVNEISTRNLPKGTVLNTFENDAFINQGSRSGFKAGQQLIIFRGAEQVATAVITAVSYDDSTARLQRSFKGIRPGDTAQVVFAVPNIQQTFANDGTVRNEVVRARRDPDHFLQVLGAFLILAVAMSGKGSSGQHVVDRVKAEATFDQFQANPGVRISFNTNAFVRGDQQKFQWQIWRNDIPTVPVTIVDGSRTFAIDDTAPDTFTWYEATRSSVTVCLPNPAEQAEITGATPIPGTPYLYQVELIYRIDARDFPEPPQGVQFCYFQSDRQSATGPATPLNRPNIQSPAQGIDVTTAIPFTTESVVELSPITVQYALQLSTSSQFPKGQTETILGPISNSGGIISMGIIDTFHGRKDFIRNATTLWWRIGARNVVDVPGPRPDASGQRYIFSVPRSFTRPNNPPPPPLASIFGGSSLYY